MTKIPAVEGDYQVTGGSNSMGYFPYLRTITWTDNDLDLPDKTKTIKYPKCQQ